MSRKEMLYIPTGEAVIGITRAQADQLYRDLFSKSADVNPYILYNEVPERKIKVPAFNISKNEVTNTEFQEFVNDGGYDRKEFWKELISIQELETDLTGWDRISLFVDRTGKPGPALWSNGRYPERKENHPVEGVSWFEAVAFCRWKKVRLPSEVEWEYAARGTDGRIFPWGDTFSVIENWGERQAAQSTVVGSISEDRSPFGVMDMSRNVSEWVEDRWEHYPDSPLQDPARLSDGYGVVRGGHYTSTAWQMRATYRMRIHKLERLAGTGFRVAH